MTDSTSSTIYILGVASAQVQCDQHIRVTELSALLDAAGILGVAVGSTLAVRALDVHSVEEFRDAVRSGAEPAAEFLKQRAETLRARLQVLQLQSCKSMGVTCQHADITNSRDVRQSARNGYGCCWLPVSPKHTATTWRVCKSILMSEKLEKFDLL